MRGRHFSECSRRDGLPACADLSRTFRPDGVSDGPRPEMAGERPDGRCRDFPFRQGSESGDRGEGSGERLRNDKECLHRQGGTCRGGKKPRQRQCGQQRGSRQGPQSCGSRGLCREFHIRGCRGGLRRHSEKLLCGPGMCHLQGGYRPRQPLLRQLQHRERRGCGRACRALYRQHAQVNVADRMPDIVYECRKLHQPEQPHV